MLSVKLPVAAEIRLIHTGQVIALQYGDSLSYTASEAGAYRVEVERNQKLWIISNPIYLDKSPEVDSTKTLS